MELGSRNAAFGELRRDKVGKPIWLAIIHPESIIGLRWENLAFSDIKKIERSESFIIH